MEDQITRANRARIETIQKKLKIDQDFNNIKKTLKAASASGGGNDFDDNVLQDVSSSAEPPEKKKEKSLGRRVGLRGSNTKANKNN